MAPANTAKGKRNNAAGATAASSSSANGTATGRFAVGFPLQILVIFACTMAYVAYSTSYMTSLMHKHECTSFTEDAETVSHRMPSEVEVGTMGALTTATYAVTRTNSVTENPLQKDLDRLREELVLQQQRLERTVAEHNEAGEADAAIGSGSAHSTRHAADNTPAWWMASDQDDYLTRTYVDENAQADANLHGLRKPQASSFFHPVCGLYRFNATQLPKVSIIITTQNEVEGAISMTIHSVLARTNPDLLHEIILVDDNGQAPGERTEPAKKVKKAKRASSATKSAPAVVEVKHDGDHDDKSEGDDDESENEKGQNDKDEVKDGDDDDDVKDEKGEAKKVKSEGDDDDDDVKDEKGEVEKVQSEGDDDDDDAKGDEGKDNSDEDKENKDEGDDDDGNADEDNANNSGRRLQSINDMDEDEELSASDREIQELAEFPNVKVISNRLKEGCARSRLIGAKAATGEVLVFLDSHIEMESATWVEHLLLPIMENPRTLSMQVIDGLSDLGSHEYSGPATPSYGRIDKNFAFGYNTNRFGQHGRKELPNDREPFETPFGPGSLFAMRRDEFWRLGGYDSKLYIWGAENTELALKTWMCGGRVVMVPCSRVGHIYRVNIGKVGRWPPPVPARLIDQLNLTFPAPFLVRKGRPDDFTKVVTRNNIRVLEVWLRDHPAKSVFYELTLGSKNISQFPEWQQYVDEMKTDPAIQKQIELREKNKCHDFEWFDKYVYMRLLGVHNPWHPESIAAETEQANLRKRPKKAENKFYGEEPADVSCGLHRASNCKACPQGHGAQWCNGDCEWIYEKRACFPVGTVTCGMHSAASCKECPQGNGQAWCNGECKWNTTRNDCGPRPSWTHPIYRRLIRQKPFQPVVNERGDHVNVVMVRTPFKSDPRAWKMFQEFKDEVLFLGISSFENFPLNGTNPWSEHYPDDTYVGLFPGFLHNMREPEKHFPPHVKHILMAQSDWIEVFPKVDLPKKYDFSYSGSNQEVDKNCVGWSSYNKNWTFVLEALDLMCDLNMTGVIFASKKDNMTCTIPEKCKGLITQTPFLGQREMFNYIRQSRFVFLPQISDASPRVSAQAIALDTPILMNKHIFGGWKYVNNMTGEFFTDMSDFQQQFTKIINNQESYSPRKFWAATYGSERLAKKFTKYVKDNFAKLAKLPPNTTMLTPLFT